MSSAAILAIGTELTRGEIGNGNGQWLAEQLTDVGLEVIAIDSVADDPNRILDALTRLVGEARLVICTGGLGPTTDDLTRDVAAAFMTEPLVRDPRSFERIRERLERHGRPMAPSNARQAEFPASAAILDNDWGTAPGFSLALGEARAYFLPGVPHEMMEMYRRHVAPAAAAAVERPWRQRMLRVFGMAESAVNDALDGVEAAHDVLLAYRAHFPEILVKVLASGDPEALGARLDAAADEVRRRLGSAVYAAGERSLAEVLTDELAERGLSVGLAEACTGGLIGKLLTDAPGASRAFRGGVIAYDNELKTSLLGVDPSSLAEHGAVSAPVAAALAEGARRLCGATYGVAATGIAGPLGGTEAKPVGTVFVAVAGGGPTLTERLELHGTRHRIRTLTAWTALMLVRRRLLGEHGPQASSDVHDQGAASQAPSER